ncbi:DinB family protein [Mucilaginibacter ximonensis]|uniref:DinB family protein n=1 Tax=Mucilaginibacter ximonensis TaxID=538021 RepID=A0ABW5YG27_9SPHI
MKTTIEFIKLTRTSLLDLVKDLTQEQLNKIPVGFNNNIVWNLAHIVATQQNICYQRGGVNIVTEERFFTPFIGGTKPEGFVSAEDLQLIKGLFFSTLEQLEADLQTDKFDNYTPWTTRYGNSVNNIEEAIAFLAFHDGIHLGYVQALKRVI